MGGPSVICKPNQSLSEFVVQTADRYAHEHKATAYLQAGTDRQTDACPNTSGTRGVSASTKLILFDFLSAHSSNTL